MGATEVSNHYVGQRLSLKSQIATVRYVGKVTGKPGDFLGVEWDDPTRGKHSGTHDGVSYFQNRSLSPTAASFLKPHQPWDESRSFLEALQAKYMSNDRRSTPQSVYFSGKEAEEIGFEKFAKRQQQLLGIHVLVLDSMHIRHQSGDGDLASIAEICAEITELDLTSNLFESFREIASIIQQMPKLRTLTLDRNRFVADNLSICTFLKIRRLNLRGCLLSPQDLGALLRCFPSLEDLAMANNEVSTDLTMNLPGKLATLDLSDNELTSLSQIQVTGEHLKLTTLILKRNKLSSVGQTSSVAGMITDLDLSYNAISEWRFFDELNAKWTELKHLRVAGNPLFNNLKSAAGKPLATADGYMLTIARLPQLKSLNYSVITEKERVNADVYYLNQIAAELSSVSEAQTKATLARHPRYQSLCEEYGEPAIRRAEEAGSIDPNSLRARFVNIAFTVDPSSSPKLLRKSWSSLVPKSFTIYALHGLVAKQLNLTAFGLTPLDLRLILATEEDSTATQEVSAPDPDWWDSEDESNAVENVKPHAGPLKKRELVLAPGSRILATYVDGIEASIRVEGADLST